MLAIFFYVGGACGKLAYSVRAACIHCGLDLVLQALPPRRSDMGDKLVNAVCKSSRVNSGAGSTKEPTAALRAFASTCSRVGDTQRLLAW